MVVVYGFGLVKFLQRENEWTRAAARLVPLLAVLAAALILVVLAIEVAAYCRDGDVPIRLPALVAVALRWRAWRWRHWWPRSCRAAIRWASASAAARVRVRRRSARRAVVPAHSRDDAVAVPRLVPAILAAGGDGDRVCRRRAGEVFQRRRQRVLSEPLRTTGALLPLLPALGFWVMSSQVHYSLLLLSIGVLYAALSVLRQSFLYGVLAAIAANGSLWYLLSQARRPQLLRASAAVADSAGAVRAGGRLHQPRAADARAIGRAALRVGDRDLRFVDGRHLHQRRGRSAVAAGRAGRLSIVGVLAGILLRVRAFLYLGTAFLIVALMTIIWHAAIDQQRTWILWVAGIVTGVLIIALFGLFEKRRDDVLRVVEQLKHWHA